MFSVRSLLLSSSLLPILGGTCANLVHSEEPHRQSKAEDVDLDRRRIVQKCSGYDTYIQIYQYLIILFQISTKMLSQSRTRGCHSGFETGEFVVGCEVGLNVHLWFRTEENLLKANYEVTLERDDQDLGQWRIKVVVEEMNLFCSSSSLLVKEDSEKTKRVKYCNEAETVTKEFFSHEHLISLTFKNKVGKVIRNLNESFPRRLPVKSLVAVLVRRYR